MHNAKLYLAFLTNRMYLTTVPHLLLLIALAAMLFAISRYRTGGPEVKSQIQIMVWAVLSLLGGVVLCLFTPYPGPYLLLLPSPFLWIALVALWRSIQIRNGVVRSVVGLGVTAGAASVMLLGLSGSYTLYGDTLSWSSNFRRSLPAIANNVPVGSPVNFVIGEAPFLAYRFVGDNGQRYVNQFIYHRTGLLQAAEARMNNVTTPARSLSGYSIVLGNELAVTEILHGSRVLYRASASPP